LTSEAELLQPRIRHFYPYFNDIFQQVSQGITALL